MKNSYRLFILKLFIKLFIFVLVLFVADRCASSITSVLKSETFRIVIVADTSQKDVTQTPDSSTETMAEIPTNTPVPTLTLIPTFAPTPTFTPTPEPPDPYVFITENREQIDISHGPFVIEFEEGALSGEVISTTLVSPQNLGVYESTSQALTLGNSVGVIRFENYGNLLLSLHSGYYHKKPLQAEVLRKYLELWGLSGDDYVSYKLAEIAGSKGTLFTSDGLLTVEIAGGVRLQPVEAEELSKNPEKVLDIVTKHDKYDYFAIGNPQIFEKIKYDGHEILITFCGWGPNQEPTYYGYVILLNIMEQP